MTQRMEPIRTCSAHAVHVLALPPSLLPQSGKYLARQTLALRGVVPMLAAPMSDGSGEHGRRACIMPLLH